MPSKTKGVFCLEGDWWNDLNRTSTVRPILELGGAGGRKKTVPFVHRDVATREELAFYLRVWTQKRYAGYPILYLAFHGSPGQIALSDWRRKSASVSLDWIAETLDGRCKGRVVHFGSCGTMDVRRSRLQKFLDATGAIAITGHTCQTDWVKSAAFELLLFDAFQDRSLTRAGARAVGAHLEREVRHLSRDLGFRMVIRGG
jgi:hypothetical protein